MDNLLDHLSETVTRARTVEELTRPLLELLEDITGFESTYLTVVDLERGVQRVLYARNTRQMQIPEGLSVPWHDTLCKRALDEGRPFTADVGQCWGDSQAAAALGIQTYASTPVRMADGQLYGTLCAASDERQELTSQARNALTLFARLIGQQVEREQLLQQLLQANARLAAYAATDMAERLRGAARAQDFVARYGGDEFVAVGPGPAPGPALEAARQGFGQRLAQATRGRFGGAGAPIDYAGASVGVIAVLPNGMTADDARREADRAMYAAKKARRAVR